VRLAASHAERDGFVKNVVDGAEYGNTDTTTGLLQLRWRTVSQPDHRRRARRHPRPQ
jgi:hypothetical protein